MKNIVNPLKWEEAEWDIKIAYAYDLVAFYEISDFNEGYAARLETEDKVIWQTVNLKSIDDAKAACQQHYAERLWDNLSEDARAILEQHLNK